MTETENAEFIVVQRCATYGFWPDVPVESDQFEIDNPGEQTKTSVCICAQHYGNLEDHCQPPKPIEVVCVKFSKLVMVRVRWFIQVNRAASLCSIGKRPSLRPDLPSGRAPRAAAVKDAAAKAVAPAEPARSVLDRASTVLG